MNKLTRSPTGAPDDVSGNQKDLAHPLAIQPSPQEIELELLGTLIADISVRLLKASSENLHQIILASLREVLQSLGLERGGLLNVSKEHHNAVTPPIWHDDGVEVPPQEINLAQLFPWTYKQVVVLGNTVVKDDVDSVPADAELDRLNFVKFNIKSSLDIPLFVGQHVHHIFSLHSLNKKYTWTEPCVKFLYLLGDIFAFALERHVMHRSMATYETRLDMAADSAGVALWELDLNEGIFWATSRAKEMFHFPDHTSIPFTSFLQRIYPEDRSLVVNAIERVQQTDALIQVEYRSPDLDGSIRWMISKGRMLQKSTSTGRHLAGVTIEITQHKAMEHKLQEQVREINRLRKLLEQENTLLRSEAGLDKERHRSLGISAAMQGVKVLIEQVAKTDSTVLIQGETGSGKELVAQAIHQLSKRGKRLMITVNCAALPAALIESELFGREKGAFTGALSRQIGRFELARDSTLLLDEIAEMPLETQVKLLRVLQDGTFERLGSPVCLKVNARIIAATNRNLAEEVDQGRFRQDLFYRLNVFPIHVPPLRERIEDIPLLVWTFISEFAQRMGRKITSVASQDMDMLSSYSWPGNVRELRNIIERAMISSKGTVLDLSHLELRTPGSLRLLLDHDTCGSRAAAYCGSPEGHRRKD